jgi:hypothetical protein
MPGDTVGKDMILHADLMAILAGTAGEINLFRRWLPVALLQLAIFKDTIIVMLVNVGKNIFHVSKHHFMVSIVSGWVNIVFKTLIAERFIVPPLYQYGAPIDNRFSAGAL